MIEKQFITCEKMESDDNEGTVVGWGSKPTVDRDKEVIESTAWNLDSYLKNPVLLLCHKHDTPPVGKCLWVRSTPQGLRFKAKFANTERGQEIYQLYKEGIMNAFSVGFKPRPGGVKENPTDTKYKGVKRVFTDVDLFEISCVPVPANGDALVEHVKAGKIICKELKEELEFIIEIKDEDDLEVKVEVTDALIHVPTPGAEGEHEGHKIRTISLSKKEGIQGKYCVECKAVISYMFDKEKWELDDAKKWVKDHNKSIALDQSPDETMLLLKSEEAEWDADGDILFKEAPEIITNTYPSIDTVRYAVDKAISKSVRGAGTGPGEVGPSPWIIEHYPVGFPEKGFVVYNWKDQYYKTDYEYATDTGEATVTNPVRVQKVFAVAKEVEDFFQKMSEYEDLKEQVESLEDQLKEKESTETTNLEGASLDILMKEATELVGGKVIDVWLKESILYADDSDGQVKYYRQGYTVGEGATDGGALVKEGDPVEIDAQAIADEYPDFVMEEKAGKVVSAKNRALLQAAMEAISRLIAADDKEEPEGDKDEGKGADFIELVEKEESDDLLEIDEELLSTAVAEAIKNAGGSVDVRNLVAESIAKMTGKVTV